MNKLSEKIIMSSFKDELEKKAIAETLLKVLKNADLKAGTSFREGLKVLGKHKDELAALSKGALKNPVHVETYGKEVSGIERGVLKGLGNMADGFLRVSEGVGKHQTFSKNVATVAKNFGHLIADQVRGAKYKTISSEKAVLTGAGGSQIKGQGIFKNLKSFNRPIVGRTTSGDFIVRKRKAALPLAMAVTPPGISTGTLLLGSGKDGDSPGSRIKESVKDTLKWSLVPPIAQAEMISDML